MKQGAKRKKKNPTIGLTPIEEEEILKNKKKKVKTEYELEIIREKRI